MNLLRKKKKREKKPTCSIMRTDSPRFVRTFWSRFVWTNLFQGLRHTFSHVAFQLYAYVISFLCRLTPVCCRCAIITVLYLSNRNKIIGWEEKLYVKIVLKYQHTWDVISHVSLLIKSIVENRDWNLNIFLVPIPVLILLK